MDNYLITWRYTGPCDTDTQSFLLDSGARSRTLEDLEEGGNFEIRLMPMNSIGDTTTSVQVSTQNSGMTLIILFVSNMNNSL